jgi:hypothetical protein
VLEYRCKGSNFFINNQIFVVCSKITMIFCGGLDSLLEEILLKIVLPCPNFLTACGCALQRFMAQVY